MEQSYKRIKNIDDKIHAAKLPYMAWKVLFLIEDEDTAPKLAEFLDEDQSQVDQALQSLIGAGLIESIEPEAEKEADEKPKPEKVKEEEPKPEPDSEEKAEEEVFPEKAEPAEKDEPAEPAKAEKETEPAKEEVAEAEAEKEAEEKTEPEETAEKTVPEEVEAPVEKSGTAADTAEDEDLDIKIAEEEPPEKVETGLDIDFAEEPEAEKEAEQEEEVDLKTTDTEESGGNIILVIDDSIVIRKMVEIALEDEDFRIETAVSGKEGLSMIDKLNPSLVILDLMLPDISGIDILKTIKASKGIPVIMLSGKDSPQMVETAKNEGANAFLPKPFKDEELVEQIKKLVNKA